MGIWIHADKDDTREANATQIQQGWEKIVAAKAKYKNQTQILGNGGIGVSPNNNPRDQEAGETGRRLSLSELFRQQSSQ
jgi:hypothetical protein